MFLYLLLYIHVMRKEKVLFLPGGSGSIIPSYSGGRTIIPARSKYDSYLVEAIPAWWSPQYYSYTQCRPKYYSFLVEAKVLFLPGAGRNDIPTWCRPK
jgi:hypothetical protein